MSSQSVITSKPIPHPTDGEIIVADIDPPRGFQPQERKPTPKNIWSTNWSVHWYNAKTGGMWTYDRIGWTWRYGSRWREGREYCRKVREIMGYE
jgi:hypothetical protein